MTLHLLHGAPSAAPAGRARGRAPLRRAKAGRAPALATRDPLDGDPERVPTTLQLEELLDRHGRSVYALACTLLGDTAAAVQAVTLGMSDLARSSSAASSNDAHRSWVRHVYWRSQELAGELSRTPHLPPAMVWLSQLAQLQRACLALCLFGGHSHHEAAELLGVPPMTVAGLLTTGLRDAERFAADGTAAPA